MLFVVLLCCLLMLLLLLLLLLFLLLLPWAMLLLLLLFDVLDIRHCIKFRGHPDLKTPSSGGALTWGLFLNLSSCQGTSPPTGVTGGW